jgi:hypothetical protein
MYIGYIITSPVGNRDDSKCARVWRARAPIYEANGLACMEKGTVANRK